MLSVWLNWTSSMLTINIPFFQLVEPLMFLVRQVWRWRTHRLVWENVTCPSLEDNWAGFTILGRCCSFVIQSFEFITPSSYCLLGFWETWSAWCPTPLNGILLGCVVCLCHGLVLLGLNHLRPLIFLSWTFYVRIEKVLFLSSLTLFLPPLYEPASPVFTCEVDSSFLFWLYCPSPGWQILLLTLALLHFYFVHSIFIFK